MDDATNNGPDYEYTRSEEEVLLYNNTIPTEEILLYNNTIPTEISLNKNIIPTEISLNKNIISKPQEMSLNEKDFLNCCFNNSRYFKKQVEKEEYPFLLNNNYNFIKTTKIHIEIKNTSLNNVFYLKNVENVLVPKNIWNYSLNTKKITNFVSFCIEIVKKETTKLLNKELNRRCISNKNNLF